MQDAEPSARDAVLTALRKIAERDRRTYVVLAWLLMPGASRIAGRIRRLVDQIDEVVAGQLWIQICDHNPMTSATSPRRSSSGSPRSRWPSSASATSPSDATRRGPRRCWSTRLMNPSRPKSPTMWASPMRSLSELLRRALDSGRLSGADRGLLINLAYAAEQVGVPLVANVLG